MKRLARTLKMFVFTINCRAIATVKPVYSFVYLGSLQSLDGQCHPDLTCRIGLICSVMTFLKRIWSDKHLTFNTKRRIYQTLVLSVLLYAADTWSLLSADVRILDAFRQKCLESDGMTKFEMMKYYNGPV